MSYKQHTNSKKMKIEVFNIRLSKEIVGWLDHLVSKGIYKSRSEAIREFSREQVKGDIFE